MTMWPRRQGRAEDAAPRDAGQAASQLVFHLQGGGELMPVQVDDLPLADGEVAYADVPCSAARYYGTEVIYPRSAGYFENHPTFGRRWVPNNRLDARRRQEAEAVAAPQWRDHTVARVVLTSTGVRLRSPGCRSTTLSWLRSRGSGPKSCSRTASARPCSSPARLRRGSAWQSNTYAAGPYRAQPNTGHPHHRSRNLIPGIRFRLFC